MTKSDAPAENPDETPILRQYRAIKAEHPGAILMFQIGDFFETLEKDAETVASVCELTLTSKPFGKIGRLPLAGVPHHAVDGYVARLVRRGYHVALCEQMEAPSKSKKIVRRAVTRIVTPGTMETRDSRANNFLGALAGTLEEKTEPAKSKRGHATPPAGWAVAFADLLTGELYTASGLERADLAAFFARFRPAEMLVADDAAESWREFLVEHLPSLHLTTIPDWRFSSSHASQTLAGHFKGGNLAALGLGSETNTASIEGVAASAVLEYLAETQKTPPSHVTTVRRLSLSENVVLDAASLLHLEINDSPSGDRDATLRAVLDRATTAMGSRLIARRLTNPLRDTRVLEERLDRVEAFVSDAILRDGTQEALRKIHDLERLAGRLSLGFISPRETVALARSLESVAVLRSLLVHPLLASLQNGLDALPEAVSLIGSAVVDEPPPAFGEGPVIREGFSAVLDGLRRASKDSRRFLAELQAKERERTGISSLKVGFNNVFGYYIEVTKSNLEKVPADFIRKQTIAGGERYYTEDLKHHEEIVLKANEIIEEKERLIFAELRLNLLPLLPRLQATAASVAEADLSVSFSTVSSERNFTRPRFLQDEEPMIRIEAGRHPVVEALLSGEDRFVPNDALLSGDSRFMLLTGPNMAGKSTYIRQVAVIALMAQVGCFVPAAQCAMTPFDAIYTRIGAGDRLARGLSTFMVEMVEAARILRGATKRSLVVLDEIGRGTSTYDGLAIAWALVEALAARGCPALFATHYHELTALSETVPGVFNATVAVREWKDKIHFLHEIRPGAADRSYGIQVAALAGVPSPVIDRAKGILANLEVGDLKARDRAAVASGESEQLSFWSDAPSMSEGEREALDAIRAASPDDLTPREAWELVERLREKLK